MEFQFIALFPQRSGTDTLSLPFAKKHVFEPLRKIIDSIEMGGHTLEEVDVLSTVVAGVKSLRVQCSIFTPVAHDNLLTVGMLETVVKDNLPSKCSLTKMAYNAEKRGFLWAVEFDFDKKSVDKLLEIDERIEKATEIAEAEVNGGVGSHSTSVVSSLPVVADREKDSLLRKRRQLDEESKVAEGELRKVRTRRDFNMIVGIGGGPGKGKGKAADIAKESSVKPTKRLFVAGRRNTPKVAISKNDKKVKAKSSSRTDTAETSDEKLVKESTQSFVPLVLSNGLPFVNRILCALAGVDTTNEASQDYAVSHRYDNDLFIQQ
jgi:hypothetical protein